MVKISVSLRSRPLGPPTATDKSSSVYLRSVEDKQHVVDQEKKFVISYCLRGGSKHEFAFDRVFGESSSQEEVFGHYSHVVDDSIEGFNACILAYGQTGA
jgi:Kinesin motor domain